VTRTNNTDLKDVWQTPQALLEVFPENYIDVDPCAGEHTDVGAVANWDKHDDGLSKEWFGTVFVNPPFSAKTDWLEKAVAEQANTECIYVVTPDSTDVKSWWHSYIAEEADYIWFSKGRISYINPETGEQAGSPTFGTALSIFGEPTDAVLETLQGKGQLLQTVQCSND